MSKDRDVLTELVKVGGQFRRTPIVDDDFPAYRDRFDRTLDQAAEYLKKPRPVVVCLCGSTRFYDAFQRANYDLTMNGEIVLSVGFAGRLDRQRVTVDGCQGPQEVEVLVARAGQEVGCTPGQKVALDDLHKRKIDAADYVLVLNVGGYVGDSTRSEIEYAERIGRPVRYLEGKT